MVRPMANKKHEAFKSAALKAIEDLFSDTSVGNLVTRDSLQELRDEINQKIDCIDADVERDLEG